MSVKPVSNAPLSQGTIVASFGRGGYLVELDGADTIRCVTHGKRANLACGDRVAVIADGAGRGVIEAVDPRSTLLFRSDAYRQKLLAANVTQIIVVLAAVPSFYEELLNRCLVAAEHCGIRALILLNKFDLAQPSAHALKRLELYTGLGYELLTLSAKQDVRPLLPHLHNHVSVLVGQSGMGKSTIINKLLPQADARVAEVSAALDSGRHTTTTARLYHLDASSHIIDSPGLQEFGLHHVARDDIAHGFVEFRPLLGQCKFNDCRHLHEPGCALIAAAREGTISERRLASFHAIVADLKHGATN